MSEMTAKEYFETRNRMTDFCAIQCRNCLIGFEKNGTERGCGYFQKNHPNEAIAIVQKWGEEHPVKTLTDKFFEVFPNAPKRIAEFGFPEICPSALGYKTTECYGSNRNCRKCWSQPYIEPKE